jgi:hypothetical protein
VVVEAPPVSVMIQWKVQGAVVEAPPASAMIQRRARGEALVPLDVSVMLRKSSFALERPSEVDWSGLDPIWESFLGPELI